MSEPRYDFMFAVLRKRTEIGYVFTGLSLVFNPSIPQEDAPRREFVRNPRLFEDIGDRLCEEHGLTRFAICFERKNASENNITLWGVVPILGIFPDVVRQVNNGYQSRPNWEVNFLLTQKFILDNSLEKWFEKMCSDLHKLGGGKYIITGTRTPEVPWFAL